MEYEKPHTSPVFSRKLRSRNHSLSFSGNVVYDGVFASPATRVPTSAIDYGEIFRVSSSSIPLLDVPELYEEKIKVDVRSSKLDYSSVFGGFEGCDLTISPEELIIKSERKSPAEEHKRDLSSTNGSIISDVGKQLFRYHKKAGNSSDAPLSTKAKIQISSPEVVSMKRFNVSYHQTAPHNENGINLKTQVARNDSVSGYTHFVDNPSPLPKMESRTPVSSFEKEPCNGVPVKVADCKKLEVDILSSNGSSKQSSKNGAEFDKIFGRNGSNSGDSLSRRECKTDSITKHPEVIPPSSLKRSIHSDKEDYERSTGPKSESFRSDGVSSPRSPPYFDEETEANSAAAASSAALKKAIEEAQIRINIAKQMMERKKAGFRGRAKQKSSDSLRVEDKGNRKLEKQTDTGRDIGTKIVGEVVNSSKQASLLVGERVLGELVNHSQQSSPSTGKRNIGEVMNSSEQSFLDKGEQNVGEVMNSSVQPFPNKVDHNVGVVVNSSFPEAGKCNAGEEVNASEQLFPDKEEQNVGEAVNSSEPSIRNGEKQNVSEVASTSEQSLPNKGEQDISDVINSPEQSSTNAEEQNVGELVSSLEKSFSSKVEQDVNEMVESFEESFPNKGEQNLGEENSSEQSIPNEEEENVGEEALNSSKQSFLDPGEQQVKRPRRLWEVPGGILKSTLHHMDEEARKHQVIKEEEHARKVRKHWEMPGGIFKSIVNGKQHETEQLEATEYATDTNGGMPKAPENSFYSFGLLGNKIRSVVEAFTGSKIAQTSEAEGTEHVITGSHENSNVVHEVLDREGKEKIVFEGEVKFVGSSDIAIYGREVEAILKPTEGQSPTQTDENAETTMCSFMEECPQQVENETERYEHSETASELHDAPFDGLSDTHENVNLICEEGEKESLSDPQEMLVGPVETKSYEMEVEEIPRSTQSTHETQIDKNAGCMVPILAENASVSGDAAERNEKEHKTPRQRRVWKTSEDVYDMIKGLKRHNRAWQLEDEQKEMMKRCLREQSERVDDAIDGEETESISEVPTDTGLQENRNILKQMFRQMIQTVDTKREDETRCLEDSELNPFEIPQMAQGADRKGTAETSIYELTGADILNNTREQDIKVEEQNESSSVYELIGEEVETIEMVNNQEAEDIPDVSEAADSVQASFILDGITRQEDACAADILDHDTSETLSSNSDEELEQKPCEEPVDETKIGSSIDGETREQLFEPGQDDSDIEEVNLEQEVYDQSPEKTSSTSSTAECVEEVDSESNKSVWDVEDTEFISKQNGSDDNLKSFLEEGFAGYAGASQSSCKTEESGETKSKLQDSEGRSDCEYPEEFDSRSNTEAAESFSSSSSKDEEENLAAADRNSENNDREDRSRSSEERCTSTGASRNEVKPVEERSKQIDKAKEKEREREKERIMVERAIREARERAFADARERAGKAAMEKANAGTHSRTASEVRGRSGKASVEANDKSSSAEKASMQAKLRAERAAVERVLAEARERALEKALSGKARGQGGKSSVSLGERRSFSSSGTENRSSAPPSSSNQSGNREPAERCRARSERCQRTAERASKALAEKKLRDLIAQKEQAERNRLAETLDTEVKRWSSGKEGNLRALISTLQYILGPDSGWKPIHLTDLVPSAAVRKAYRKAALYVHPDKLQQRGAATQQKYICEKVFDLLKDAWNKFSAEER